MDQIPQPWRVLRAVAQIESSALSHWTVTNVGWPGAGQSRGIACVELGKEKQIFNFLPSWNCWPFSWSLWRLASPKGQRETTSSLQIKTNCNSKALLLWASNHSGNSVFLRVLYFPFIQISLLLLSPSVVSSSLWPHGLQHTRPPCPSPTPGLCSNSHPLSRQCHSTISSSAVPFSSSPQSFPASGSFPMSLLFASGGQSIGASTTDLPMTIQC